MALRPLGKLGVPPLCLGTSGLGNIGGIISDATAFETVDATVTAAGTAYVETSPAYGLGLSEKRVGRALSHHQRTEVILQTKVGYYLRRRSDGATDATEAVHSGGCESPPCTMEWDFSGPAVCCQHQESLHRLGMANVDALVIHGMDHAVAAARKAADSLGEDSDEAEEVMLSQLDGPDGGIYALQRLRAQGQIGAIGVALNEECPIHPNDEAARVAWNLRFFKRVLGCSTDTNSIDFVLVAGMHTLLNFSAFQCGILDAAAAAGVSVLAAAPFNSGILTREDGNFDGAWYSYASAPFSIVSRANELLSICQGHGVSLRAAALAFPWGHPAVASVIVGAKSAKEWHECVALVEEAKHIPPAFWEDLHKFNLVPLDVPLPYQAV